MNEVCDFIKRRFSENSNWLNGNCYYFAIILKDRFPQGRLWYDFIDGHFIIKIDGNYYDWTGQIFPDESHLYYWTDMPLIDTLLYQRIIRDCIK